MSASKTNLKKQVSRHRGPLIGIVVAVATATILFVIYLMFLADTETFQAEPEPIIEDTGAIPAPGSPATPDAIADPDARVIEQVPEPGEQQPAPAQPVPQQGEPAPQQVEPAPAPQN